MIVLGDEVDLPPFASSPRFSSASSTSSSHVPRSSSPVSAPEDIDPPAKKRRLSLTALQSDNKPPFRSAYIGSFLVVNAWSTVKGKGYIKNGDEICVELDNVDEASSKIRLPSNGKGAQGKKKQLSIDTMFKAAQQSKPAKKKLSAVVHLTNKKGFGMLFHDRAFTDAYGHLQNLAGSHKILRSGSANCLNLVCKEHGAFRPSAQTIHRDH